MAEKAFHLEVVAPDRSLFSGEVTSVTAPGTEGSFGVLANHAPLISALAVGELKVRGVDGRERVMALTGGFFEVSRNHAIVLADAGEWAEEIDIARAEKALHRAQDRLATASAAVDVDRAARALARAKSRLKVAKGASGTRMN